MEAVHYRCTFDIYPSGDLSPTWRDIVKSVRSWISNRLPPSEALGAAWFFTGGILSIPGQPRLKVTTAATEADGLNAPEFWAICFEHPDSGFSVRVWRTHIGITRCEDRFFRLSLTLGYSLIPGFIDEAPPPPIPSAPAIVKSLIKSNRWTACSGSEKLRVSPELLRVGGGPDWRHRLFDPKRGCPLVFIAQSQDGGVHVDPNRLATLLAGVANVVTPESPAVDQELQWVLPERLRTWGGAVRVYVPGITATDDGRRHRFFSSERIAELTPVKIEDLLVEALARRSAWLVPGLVTTIEDVATRRRELRLQILRQSAGEVESLREWIQLLEAENKSASSRLNLLSANVSELTGQLDQAETEREDASKALLSEKRLTRQERERANAAEARMRQLEEESRALRDLEGFPESVLEVIALASSAFGDRIEFTESAIKSAEHSDFAGEAEMSEIWRCLRSVATVLFELYFPSEGKGPEPGTIPQRFEAATGFPLAPTESAQTRKDKSLMKKRKVMHRNVEIDIEPHVKHDKGGKFFRVHFHVADRVLIIGHCGDHMETAGTRRNRK